MRFLRLFIFSIVTFLYLIPAVSSFAQMYHGQPVTHVSLIAGNMVTGKGFTLGIRMQLNPGWHTYWKNPGDAGFQINAELIDANGFSAGELKFPTPYKIINGGEVLYAYDSEVVFLLPIKPPKDVKSSPQFKVKLNWLACKEVCIPGEATIPFIADSISANDRKTNQRILDHWTAKLPQPGIGFNLNKAEAVVTQKDDKLSVFIKFLEMAPGTVKDFFPEVINGFVNYYSDIIVGDDGITLTLTPSSKDSKLTEIKGIAVIGTTGYEVDFPVK